MGNQNSKRAMGMLHRLLEQQDALSIYGMVVRQFRLLLLTRETLDRGGQKNDVIQDLKVAPFVADKLISQVRHFSLPDVEAIYRRLLDIDEAMKTSQVPGELALETLVAVLSAG
jgi:DNA polymerase-3 subunit delta